MLPAVTGCQHIALHKAIHAPQAKQQAGIAAAAATADAAKAMEGQKAAQQQASTPAVEKRLVHANLTAAEKVL